MVRNRNMAGLGAVLLLLPGTGSATPPSAEHALSPHFAAEQDNVSRSDQPLVRSAENEVRHHPAHAQARYMLGGAYLAAGRFLSAEQALADALRLDPELNGASFKLVMVQLALGKKADALTRIDAMAVQGREADIGLALALAGDIDRARQLLGDAARDERASPRIRQNLAFVEALAGRWANAAAIAAQDVPPERMAERLRRWAMIAQLRDAPALQMGALIGVVPQADPGMPEQLALLDDPIRSASVDSAKANGSGPNMMAVDHRLEQDGVRPTAYSGPPRMRSTRATEANPTEAVPSAAPAAGNGRSLYRAGSRRGMTLSGRANRFPVRLVAVCASDTMPVLGHGQLKRISLYGTPRSFRRRSSLRSA
ncbi:MAG: hypothetical protein ACOY5R_03165 [Pseudomonadota bacterium]